MKYIIILMDSFAPSFCYADNTAQARFMLPLDHFAKAIRYAMLNGLSVHIVSSMETIPQDYAKILDGVSHIIIGKQTNPQADIMIVESQDELKSAESCKNIIVRLPWKAIRELSTPIIETAKLGCRINLVITDGSNWTDIELQEYEDFLSHLAHETCDAVLCGWDMQINALTDRIFLNTPNHCNAGVDNITIGPNGSFYLCPSFYYNKMEPVGNLSDGLNIPNNQLLHLDHSPICQKCDAWQCRRCVWLNMKHTGEIGIPGHEQCVMSHIEREASRYLLEQIRTQADYLPEIQINTINYNDPFDLINI